MNLKTEIRESIISLARVSQVLIFGEIHGTQEVPGLVSELLDDLQANDFRILGLELPHAEQDQLRRWAFQEIPQPPSGFSQFLRVAPIIAMHFTKRHKIRD